MGWDHNRGRQFGSKPFKAVPDRWEDYTNAGNRISGTRFVCMKVPLKEELSRLVEEDKRFTPTQMMSVLKERGMNLGLLIDLTNTKRYYNPEELTSSGVAYQKIYVEGHEVPSSEVLNRFFTIVDRFEKEQKEPEDGEQDEVAVIGVHCTHGINRTGYLVCRYLIDRLGWSVDKAIEEFNQARGHPIERENYLKALQTPPSSPSESQTQEDEMPSSNATSADRGWNRREYRASPNSGYKHSRNYHSGDFAESQWGTTSWHRRDWPRQDDGGYQHYGRQNDNRYHDSHHYSGHRYVPYDQYHHQRRWEHEQPHRGGWRGQGGDRWRDDGYRTKTDEGNSGNGSRHETRFYQYVP